MRIRESGMPEVALWESFFEAQVVLARLGLDSECRDVVEFGCGYGTFTLPAAGIVKGTVFALDIDPDMLAIARQRALDAHCDNIEFCERDFMQDGTGLPDGTADFAMVFNILHCDEPLVLLREARRNLASSGIAAVIHWAHDRDTPRGPPMALRPSPAQCRTWAMQADLEQRGPVIDLPPHHYGLLFTPRA